MKHIMVFAVTASLSFGLVTESFRYQSTAGLFEDDYDLLFDPARIPEIGGYRLWTSLANLVTGDEELFADGSQPFFIIGGVAGLGNYYPGLMYDRRADKTALPTGLFDPFGTPLYGDAEVTTINWNNPDTLGNFTDRTVQTNTVSAYEAISSSDWYLAAAMKMNDDARLGLGFMHSDYTSKLTDPANNFGQYFITEDLVGDTAEYLRTVDFAGDDIARSCGNDFILSGWLDRERVSFGLNVRFALLSETNEAVILGDSAEYDLPMHPDTNYTLVSITDSLYEPRSGNRISVGMKSFYDYNENVQGRFYFDIFMSSLAYGDDAADYFFETREESYNDYAWDTVNTATYYEGSGDTKGLSIGTKHLFSITPRFKFGMGLFFSTSAYSNVTTTRDTTVSIHVFDNGDTVAGPEDFRRTVTQSETWETNVEGSTNRFLIPVGIEFNVLTPLVFRLGAQHSLSYNDYTTTTEMIEYEPQHTVTVYGDGTVTEVYADPGTRPERSVVQQTEKLPATNYYYGLGWAVNHNLQIDLMGFSELTDLEGWRLSATLKFD